MSQILDIVGTLVGDSAKDFVVSQVSHGLQLLATSTWKAAVTDERDARWQQIVATSDALTIAVTGMDPATQLAFESSSTRSLLSAYVFAQLALRGSSRARAKEKLREAFKNTLLASKSQRWTPERATDVWDPLTDLIDHLLPDLATVRATSPESLEHLITADQSLLRSQPTAPAFISRLLEVSSSPERLLAATQALDDLRTAVISREAMLGLQHLKGAARTALEDLFVDRDLEAQRSNTRYPVSSLISPKVPFRCVVIGDPGVGKSTLTAHLSKTLADAAGDGSAARTPLLLRSKDYAAQAWNMALLEAASFFLHQDESSRIQEDTLADLAVLGRVSLIIDGLDEILELGQRLRMIERIEAFCRRFPLCSVLVTSRSVGYKSAELNPKLFRQYTLPPFSELQVREYAHRWFTLKDAGHLAEAFMRESTSVSDIRDNPLMLSLLCTLFQARGDIPRDRYNIYRECADLLFHRWDSMRQIEVPEDLRRYGPYIMQDLALWYFRSQSAQAGVGQRQLEKIISVYYESSGVAPEESRARAAVFLEYCAGRAWLLGVKGAPKNERVFVFTHRTFMEFYAAEALSRRASSVEGLADEVTAIYDSDPSSVLPDLIVQAIEMRRIGGARDMVQSLLAKGEKYFALCLRVMNLASLDASIRSKVFDAVFNAWSRNVDSRNQFLQLLSLDPDPRRQFDRALKAGSADPRSAWRCAAFIARWSRVVDSADRYMMENWTPVIDDITPVAQEYLRNQDTAETRQLGRPDHLAMRNYLVDSGAQPARSSDVQELLLLPGFHGDPPSDGAVLRALKRLTGANTPTRPWDARTLDAAADSIGGATVGRSDAYHFLSRINDDYLAWHPDKARFRRRSARILLYWMAALGYEIDGGTGSLDHLLSLAGVNMDPYFRRRGHAAGSVSRSRRTGDAPDWLESWASCALNFLAD